MYRDAAIDFDEHDRAVSAILIGETLITQCERAAATVANPRAPDRWRAVRNLHDDYPEIWRQLDRARQLLSARGENTLGYEELRPYVRSSIVSPGTKDEQKVDVTGLDDARRALDELKLAVPGTDWKAIAKRTAELVVQPHIQKPWRLIGAVIATGFVLGVLSWFLAITPAPRIDTRAGMRLEIADVAQQRDARIDRLGLVVPYVCEPKMAREYIRLLVLDGRSDPAKAFGAEYTARCGDDRSIANWAKAPRPR